MIGAPEVGVRVPTILAEILVTTMAFCIYASVIYGIIAVVVQYVQIFNRSVLASDILTDSEGRLLIRLMTSSASVSLLVFSISSSRRPALYYKLTQEGVAGSQCTTIVTMALCLVLLLTSLTLKLRISRENQQLNPEAGGNAGQGLADFKDAVMR